ncbi:MAG TPA: hypothetical protein VKE51_03995 [Vicinamibacterales bacterium]|nr:hypothetical protein [Vicinamibacterales bacterium]
MHTTPQIPERRTRSGDRRRNPRNGRRRTDPGTAWRRIAWLFGAYAIFLSIRSLPASMTRSLPDTVKRAVPDRVKSSVKRMFGKGPVAPP